MIRALDSNGDPFYFELNKWMLHTLVYRKDVQDKINVQVGKFLENIKRADQKKAVQGGIFSQN
jgi:hypothetical protein